MTHTDNGKRMRIGGHSAESIPEYGQIQSRLGHLTAVSALDIPMSFVFSVLFVEAFLNDAPNYEISKGTYGATRSNWTYHTAMAIAQACKMLDLTCRFEALGKRDAVIETKDERPETVLVAEWEWDYEDIFGERKELDKLKASCLASKTADAFLLIYCPMAQYLDHLQRVAEEWIGAVKEEKTPPSLYLHTIIFKERNGFREFERIATVQISPEGVDVWKPQDV